MRDDEIVGLYFARSELAVGALQEKYGGPLLKVSSAILGGRADAEECLNDAHLAIWNSIPPERPKSLRAYACRVIRNLSFRRLEYNLAEKRSPRHEVPLEELEASLSGGNDLGVYENVDFSVAVNGFLEGLKPQMRIAFLKRYYFFDSVAEISRDMNISESKVKSMLMRARRKFICYFNEKEDML